MLDQWVDGRRGGGGGGAFGFAPDQDANFPPDVALAYAGMLKAPPKATFDQRWTVWGSAFGGTSRIAGDPVIGIRMQSGPRQERHWRVGDILMWDFSADERRLMPMPRCGRNGTPGRLYGLRTGPGSTRGCRATKIEAHSAVSGGRTRCTDRSQEDRRPICCRPNVPGPAA